MGYHIVVFKTKLLLTHRVITIETYKLKLSTKRFESEKQNREKKLGKTNLMAFIFKDCVETKVLASLWQPAGCVLIQMNQFSTPGNDLISRRCS